MILTSSTLIGRSVNLERIEKQSPQLAKDICFCYEKRMKQADKWGGAESTFFIKLSSLLSVFEHSIDRLPYTSKETLLKLGLRALESNNLWVELENSGHLESGVRESTGYRACKAWHTLAQIYFNDPDLLPPSKFNLRGYITDISKLYAGSDVLVKDYRCFLDRLAKGSLRLNTIKIMKANTHGIIVHLLKDKRFRQQLSEHGLKAFERDNNLLNRAKSYSHFTESSFRALLKGLDIKHFQTISIELAGSKVDCTELHNLSPALYNNMVNFASYIEKEIDLKPQTRVDKISFFKRTLTLLKNNLTEKEFSTIVNNGVQSLLQFDGLLQKIFDCKYISNKEFNLIHSVCKANYPKETPEINSLRKFHLLFSGVDKNRDLIIDFNPINNISEKLYQDLEYHLKHTKISMDEKVYNETTLHHEYSQLKALLNVVTKSLKYEHLSILRAHGMRGFEDSSFLVQNHILAEIQSYVINDGMNRTTANTYRDSLKWFLNEFGLTFTNTYPIPISKDREYTKHIESKDFYSELECRELAFHIEKVLAKRKTSLRTKVLLYYAKILLKTGWNVAPTLALQCGDIIEIKSPLSNKSEYAVVIQKARAGYRSDSYTFDQDSVKESSLRSAALDIIYVRDVLTKKLRQKYAGVEGHECIFIFEKKGKLIRLQYSLLKSISHILATAGCKIPFIQAKVRKGGLNHIYRKVSKDISRYTAISNHSFEVFESHYFREDPNQSRYSLSQATRIMGNYFTGKEISREIKILTDEPRESHQVTPSGTCLSLEESEEAIRYRKEHRKIPINDNSQKKQFCADFLSCIWCKYFRIVLDPEHVWKLLTYRDYILNSMEVSITSLDSKQDQEAQIDILKQRVSDILKHLRERDNNVVKEGEKLIKDHGMHPDWEFTMPPLDNIGEH